MQNIRPAADSFQRTVTNLVTTFFFNPVGHDTTFMAGSAPINVWIPTQLTLVLRLMAGDLDPETGAETTVSTVTILPNTDEFEPECWDVIGDRVFEGQRVTVGSFKTIEAAVGFALELVCARNWYAGAQNAHDAVAV